MSNQFLPLDVHSSAMNEMKSHGEDAFPNECWGFFYGEENNRLRVVTLAQRIENVKEGGQRRRVETSGKDCLTAESVAAKEGLTLHSS